jgi:hypothetical protein
MAAGLPQGLAPSMQATVLASMGLTPQQVRAYPYPYPYPYP